MTLPSDRKKFGFKFFLVDLRRRAEVSRRLDFSGIVSNQPFIRLVGVTGYRIDHTAEIQNVNIKHTHNEKKYPQLRKTFVGRSGTGVELRLRKPSADKPYKPYCPSRLYRDVVDQV